MCGPCKGAFKLWSGQTLLSHTHDEALLSFSPQTHTHLPPDPPSAGTLWRNDSHDVKHRSRSVELQRESASDVSDVSWRIRDSVFSLISEKFIFAIEVRFSAVMLVSLHLHLLSSSLCFVPWRLLSAVTFLFWPINKSFRGFNSAPVIWWSSCHSSPGGRRVITSQRSTAATLCCHRHDDNHGLFTNICSPSDASKGRRLTDKHSHL